VYLALTLVGFVVLGLSMLGVPPFGALSGFTLAWLLFALFALASLLYRYDVYRWERRTDEMPPDFVLTLGEDVPLRTGVHEENDEQSRETE
jgi:membrane protein implicated in regulation of membrane protease activity